MMFPSPDSLKWAQLLQETLQQLAKLEERLLRLEDSLQSQRHLLNQLCETMNERISMATRLSAAAIAKNFDGRGKNNVSAD
jgi:Mg2+ and Co2+ transporter CorA